jgi:hypothetical protein
MTNDSLIDWRKDKPKPAYALPLIVDAPTGKRDISDWAARQVRFDYWLALRSGTSEWSARTFVPESILNTLDHGKTYTRAELGIAKIWQHTSLKLPDKMQFIVEKL